MKAIAISSAFFATYGFELTFRVYEFITKTDVDPMIDLIGTLGICSNTLLNSIILLRFDGFVQSSALEMLGLQDWWKETMISKVGSSHERKVKIVSSLAQEGAIGDNELATTTRKSPNSLGTEIIETPDRRT